MDTYGGLPALADSDPASLIGQASRELRAALVGWPGVAPGDVGTPWTTLTLLNGWSNVTGVAAWRRFGPLVLLRGEVQGSASGSANPILILPLGARPVTRLRQPCGWGLGITYYSIDTAGALYSGAGFGSTPGLSLTGIVYPAAV